MAVPPKILGSCARTEVPSRVKGMWKMQDERELKKRKKNISVEKEEEEKEEEEVVVVVVAAEEEEEEA